jgi:hypothetical protein
MSYTVFRALRGSSLEKRRFPCKNLRRLRLAVHLAQEVGALLE